MSLLQRRADLDLAGFSQHWRTVHRELALRLVAPGIMRGYVQNHRIGLIDGLAPAADGVPEVWVDDLDAVRRLAGAPEYLEGAALDEPNFMDMSDFANLMLHDETAVLEGPGRRAVAGLVKAMLFFAAPLGRGHDAFKVLLHDAAPVRLSYHRVVDPSDDLPTPAYAGVETSWWPDVSTFEAAWRRRAATVDPARLRGMLVREEPVLWPD